MLRIPTFAAIFGLALLTSIPTSRAADIFTPPTGFWIAPSNHSKKLYGPTKPSATWNVAQWDIPSDLPPFVNGKTENQYAMVEFTADGGYQLRQTTTKMPCDRVYKSGRNLVNEFDLFVAPNGSPYPDYPSGSATAFPTLAQAKSVHHQLTLSNSRMTVTDSSCRITRGTLITAIVLRNVEAKQTFFYQIRLFSTGKKQGRMTSFYPSPNFFFTGENIQSGGHGQFGFTDNSSDLGNPVCSVDTTCHFDFQLADRLKKLIRLGHNKGVDQDLSHWVISGTYHGSVAFGHIDVRSWWNGFKLTVIK
jgi:hypothetical protein